MLNIKTNNEKDRAVKKDKKAVGIQSVTKAFHLLRAIVFAEGPCRLSELANATGISPSLARAYLLNLQSNGVVRQDEQTGLYDVGIEAVHLGLAALRRLNLICLAKPAMENLCNKLHEPNSLSIWGEKGITVAYNVELHNKLPYELKLGSLARATTTAAGHCFLAYMNSGDLDAVIESEGNGYSPSAEDRDTLAAALAEVREHGVASRHFILVDREDAPPRPVNIIAAPIFGHDGQVRAAITILSQNPDFDISSQGGPARALLGCTETLSGELGGLPSQQRETT
jgi:DNA-binding IclR family transcriptional regulator